MNTDEHGWMVMSSWNVAMGATLSRVEAYLCSSVLIRGSYSLSHP